MIKAMWDYVNVRYLNQKGQGMVEYALILAFVVVIAGYLVGNDSIGNAIKDVFDNVKGILAKGKAKS